MRFKTECILRFLRGLTSFYSAHLLISILSFVSTLLITLSVIFSFCSIRVRPHPTAAMAPRIKDGDAIVAVSVANGAIVC